MNEKLIPNTRVEMGHNFVPDIKNSTPGVLQAMNWITESDWEITARMAFGPGLSTSSRDPRPILAWHKDTHVPANGTYVGMLCLQGAQGSLSLYDNLEANVDTISITGKTPVLSVNGIVDKLSSAPNTYKTHDFTVELVDNTLTVYLNGEILMQKENYMGRFNPRGTETQGFTVVQLGKCVSYNKSTPESALYCKDGQMTELFMTDHDNKYYESRVYSLITHSNTAQAPVTERYSDHSAPTDKSRDLTWNTTGQTAASFEEILHQVFFLAGPDRIDNAGYYTYHISHGFAEPQIVNWNTNGTHYPFVSIQEHKEGSTYFYSASFLVEPSQYPETTMFLNANIKNYTSLNKPIVDARDPGVSAADVVIDYYTTPSYGETIEVAKTSLDTQKIYLHPFALSNFTDETADVHVVISSTDNQRVLSYATLNAAKTAFEIPYNQFINTNPLYGNFAEVTFTLEAFKKGTMADNCAPIATIAKKYFFDKSSFFAPVDNSVKWHDDDVWTDNAEWVEIKEPELPEEPETEI